MSNGVTSGEAAPSRLRADEPTLARYAGGIGWGLVVVGLVGVLANRWFETPRLLVPSQGAGWLFVLVGLTLAIVHAAMETDEFLRRVLGLVGAAMLVGGIFWGAGSITKEKSWALGLIPAVPGLFLIALHIRREQDEGIRRPALLGLGIAGLLLCAVGVGGTIIWPQWLPARLSMALVFGFVLMLMYLGFAGVANDFARTAAQILGAIGGVGFIYAFLRAAIPDIVHDWRDASNAQQVVLAACAAGLTLLLLGLVAIFVLGKPPEGGAPTDQTRSMARWGRIGALIGIFLLLMGALRYLAPGMLANSSWGVDAPRPYLVPTGFVLMGVGLIYGFMALGFLSENPLVVLTRRELMAYFVSPIAYCVMAGFVLMAAQAYFIFVDRLQEAADAQAQTPEPIVQGYVISFLQVVAVMVAVSLVTMRLFAEEKRSGTLEVLMTAPVGDVVIVLSKFLAVWMFFLLLWVPWWTFLLALRLEGGQEFDSRPMIGFLLTLVACSAAFMAMGMFFSSLTRDQIISAALTFLGMALLVGAFFVEKDIKTTDSLRIAAKAILRAVSFIHTWIEATEGKVYVRDIVCQFCIAIFFLFATVKVLEFRRWS